MACETVRGINGMAAAVRCGRRSRNICHECGRPMTSQCDATRKDGRPCDLPMCDEHRHKVAEDTDVCKYHFHTKYIRQAISKREEREEARRYFLEEYKKQDFRVAHGHWPDFATKEEVDQWIEGQNKMIGLMRKEFDKWEGEADV